MKKKKWIPLLLLVFLLASLGITVYANTQEFYFFLRPGQKASQSGGVKDDNEQNAYVTVTSVANESAHINPVQSFWLRIRDTEGNKMTHAFEGTKPGRYIMPYIEYSPKGSERVLWVQSDSSNILGMSISGRWTP